MVACICKIIGSRPKLSSQVSLGFAVIVPQTIETHVWMHFDLDAGGAAGGGFDLIALRASSLVTRDIDGLFLSENFKDQVDTFTAR